MCVVHKSFLFIFTVNNTTMKKLFLTLTIIAATQMNAQLKPIAYADGAQKLNGFEFTPAKPLMGKPGILILPA